MILSMYHWIQFADILLTIPALLFLVGILAYNFIFLVFDFGVRVMLALKNDF